MRGVSSFQRLLCVATTVPILGRRTQMSSLFCCVAQSHTFAEKTRRCGLFGGMKMESFSADLSRRRMALSRRFPSFASTGAPAGGAMAENAVNQSRGWRVMRIRARRPSAILAAKPRRAVLAREPFRSSLDKHRRYAVMALQARRPLRKNGACSTPPQFTNWIKDGP